MSVDSSDPPPWRLERDTTVDGVALPAGAEVLVVDGRPAIVTLPRPWVVLGIPCAAEASVFLMPPPGRPEGPLHVDSALLAEEFVAGGLRLRADTVVLFWGPDELAEGTLAEAAVVDGVALPAGSRVGFFEGLPALALVGVPVACAVRGLALPPGGVVDLAHDGTAHRTGDVWHSPHDLTYVLRDGTDGYVDARLE